jgi:O-antigen ligase
MPSAHARLQTPGRLKPRESLVLAFILAAEVALLLRGPGGGNPFSLVFVAMGAVYLLVAFRAPEVAWLLAFACVPLSREVPIPGGAISVPTEPMIGLALAGWGLRTLLAGGIGLRPSRIHAPLAACAVVSLVSIVFGLFPVAGVKAWIVSAGYAAFGYFYVAATPWSEARRKRWVRLAVTMGAALGLYGALRVIAAGFSQRLAYGLGRPFFPEHGTYAAFLAFLLPISLFEAIGRRGWPRIAYSAAFVAISLGLMLSFTRAAWVAVAIVVPVAMGIWAYAKHGSRQLVWAVFLVLTVAALMVAMGSGRGIVAHMNTITSVDNASNLERWNRWMAASEMARDHPALGVGYGGYEDAYPLYRRAAIVTEMHYLRFGAHSEPLRLLSETGLAGLLAGIWLVVAALVAGLRSFFRLPDPAAARLALAITTAIALYAVHGVFNSYLGIDKVSVPFWLSLGALAAFERETGRTGPDSHARLRDGA